LRRISAEPFISEPDPVALHDPDLVSILLPVYNEQDSILACYEELTTVLRGWDRPFEMVFVNDGSTDGTGKSLDELARKDARVRVVHFRTNYGQTAAVTAAIDYSRGAILVPMDADLQNDPADIPALVRKLEDGYDVVSGWRRNRQDSFSRVLPSRCANWLISFVSGVPLHDYGCSLKAYRRDVIADVRLYGEMHRFIPIYARMSGGKVTEMVVGHRPRKNGRSKYGFERVFKVVLDLLVVKFFLSFAAKPIYIFGGFGMLCLLASLAPAGLAVFYKLASGELHKDFVATPLPIVAATLVLVGVLATLQGIIAEVLMRTYFESQGRRPYRVKALVELDTKSE
jgi:glycosyltransferase involved in cell wall biosynthesis